MEDNLLKVFSNFYGNLPNSVQIINEKGEVVYFNNKFAELWGVNTSSFNDYNIFNDSIIRKNRIDEKLKNCFLNNETIVIDKYVDSYLSVNKPTFPILNSTAFRINYNNINFVVIIHNNNTEIILAETEILKARDMYRESERLKNSFLNTLSHEIRTPFNIILGYSSILKESLYNKVSQEDQNLINNLNDGSERLFKSLTQMLEFAQIEAGKFNTKIESLNLINILKSILDKYNDEISSNNLELKKIYSSHSIMVDADSTCLTNAINIIIENAVKYTKQGYIEIETSELINKNLALCKIKDTGIGISQDYINNLFAPFSQEDLSIGRPYEGNGLGLALAKKYIEKIDGSILVDTIKGVGTTFTIAIPLSKK